jgi:hypothetical protein
VKEVTIYAPYSKQDEIMVGAGYAPSNFTEDVTTVVLHVSYDLCSRGICSNVRVWSVPLLLIARAPVRSPVILPVKVHSPYTSRTL